MSRQIHGTIHSRNQEWNHTSDGKLVITTLTDDARPIAFLLKNNRLIQACPFTESVDKVGAIYLGKVKNVQKNINACFVEIQDKELVYLPLNLCTHPFITNRVYDGRILEGDELLIQIERAALKTKQAAATAKITLQGKYAVFSTGSEYLGISSKISAEERDRIAASLHSNNLTDNARSWRQLPQMLSYGAVIRTDARALDEAALLKELEQLESQFVQIFARAGHASCFTCLSGTKEPWESAIRQIPVTEYSEVVTDLPDITDKMYTYFQDYAIPLRKYEDDSYPLKSLYGLYSKLKEATERRIWLKSGAYLVFDTTEALNVIDVNSGKYDARRASDDTFYHINLEAAKEIALQIRLRNLSGIILADFINMTDFSRQTELLDYMRDLLKQDPVHTTAVDITPLGLMEITRKKVNQTLTEQLHKTEGKP